MTDGEQLILDRFREKTRMAGGPRKGFVLRKASILFARDDHADVDFETALAALVERDVLKVNESGDFYFLTEAGIETLEAAVDD